MKIKQLCQILFIMTITVLTTQFVFGQKKTPVSAKTPLVSQLIALTVDSFPAYAFQKGINDGKKGLKEKVLADITQKLETTDRYTSEQKSRIKPKLPELIDIMLAKFDTAVAKHFTIDNWVKESLTANLTKSFTSAQLRQLIAYFKGADGKTFLKFIEGASADGVNHPGVNSEPELNPETEATVGKFLQTPVGSTFFTTFVMVTVSDVKNKSDVGLKNMMKDLEKDLNPAALNQLIKEFLEKDSE